MAAAAIICAACGAKVKSGRAKCLRCGEPLVARADTSTPRQRPWKTIGLVAAAAALGVIGMLVTGRSTPPPASVHSESSGASQVRQVVPRGDTAVLSKTEPTPANVAVSDLIAGQQAYASGDFHASLQKLQAAADANPDDVRALNDLGQVLVRTGRAREAIVYLDKAVSLEPDSWAYQFNRARAYAQLQEWGKAIEGYRTAARLFPDDYATHYNLAKALQAAGDVSAALAAYEKAIQLAPGQSDFQLSYGLALETAKRPRDAAAAYRRYLELEPDAPQAEKVRAHLAGLES